MSLELYYTDAETGEFVLASDRVRVGTIEVNMMAAECAVGSSQIVIDDPDGTFYTPGLKPLYLKETEAEDDEWFGIIGAFMSWNRVIRRGPYRTGQGREVVINVNDVNTLLTLRVQKGTDSQRDQETDVVRINDWLVNTAEVIGGFGDNGFAIEDQDFLFDDDPVTMSETNYEGQDSAGVINDALQDGQPAKNAYLFNSPLVDEPFRIGMWYGTTERTDFTCPHSISNDLADIDPDTLTWFTENPVDLDYGAYTFAPSIDAELDRDPSRQITGGMLQWDGGNTYVSLPLITPTLTRRDMVFAGELVKNTTQAVQRMQGYLDRLSTEDDAITCAVVVPARLVNGFHQGMRVAVRFTYMAPEGYAGDPVYLRIAQRTVRQLPALVDGKRLYEIALDLRAEAPPSPDLTPPDPEPGLCEFEDPTPAGEYLPNNSDISQAPGNVHYYNSGSNPPSGVSIGYDGQVGFPVYGSGGSTDFIGDCTGTFVRCVVIGDGTITVHTTAWSDPRRRLRARLIHEDGAIDVVDESQTGIVQGSDIVFQVSSHDGVHCTHVVDITDSGGICGAKWGFAGFTWEPAS